VGNVVPERRKTSGLQDDKKEYNNNMEGNEKRRKNKQANKLRVRNGDKRRDAVGKLA
jgi:hypothetical protein